MAGWENLVENPKQPIGASGKAVADFGFHYLVTVGEEAKLIAEAASSAGLKSVRRTDSHQQAVEALLEYLEPGDVLLVKGSLSSAMDRVVHGLGVVFDQGKGSAR